MPPTCFKSSVSLGAAIGIAAATLLLTALLVFKGNTEGLGDAAPFLVIMLGSALVVGSSGGGCCCVTKLLSRKKPAQSRAATRDELDNPFAPK